MQNKGLLLGYRIADLFCKLAFSVHRFFLAGAGGCPITHVFDYAYGRIVLHMTAARTFIIRVTSRQIRKKSRY